MVPMIGVAVLLCSIYANIHPAVAVPGASCHRGCLIPYNGFDPARPTIVITHGFNPLVGKIRLNQDASFSSAIRQRCGDRFNLMGWDWNRAAFDYLNGRRNTNMAIRQGQMLACRLRAMGIRPDSTWLIGHSLGAVVVATAASELAEGSSCRVAQVTLLDPVGASSPHLPAAGCGAKCLPCRALLGRWSQWPRLADHSARCLLVPRPGSSTAGKLAGSAGQPCVHNRMVLQLHLPRFLAWILARAVPFSTDSPLSLGR